MSVRLRRDSSVSGRFAKSAEGEKNLGMSNVVSYTSAKNFTLDHRTYPIFLRATVLMLLTTTALNTVPNPPLPSTAIGTNLTMDSLQDIASER